MGIEVSEISSGKEMRIYADPVIHLEIIYWRQSMTGRNQTVISEFLLLGLPIESEQQNLFYALFLAMYLTTILGNLIIIVLIRLDSHLHTPILRNREMKRALRRVFCRKKILFCL